MFLVCLCLFLRIYASPGMFISFIRLHVGNVQKYSAAPCWEAIKPISQLIQRYIKQPQLTSSGTRDQKQCCRFYISQLLCLAMITKNIFCSLTGDLYWLLWIKIIYFDYVHLCLYEGTYIWHTFIPVFCFLQYLLYAERPYVFVYLLTYCTTARLVMLS